VASDGERARVVPRGRQQDGGGEGPHLIRSRSDPAVGGPVCSVLCERALHWERRWEGEDSGPAGPGGRGWAPVCAADWRAVGAARSGLTLERAGGGEGKKARSCRDSMTVCCAERTPRKGDWIGHTMNGAQTAFIPRKGGR
jgi:hypothetical protein